MSGVLVPCSALRDRSEQHHMRMWHPHTSCYLRERADSPPSFVLVTAEKRQAQATRIREKYPERIPVRRTSNRVIWICCCAGFSNPRVLPLSSYGTW